MGDICLEWEIVSFLGLDFSWFIGINGLFRIFRGNFII